MKKFFGLLFAALFFSVSVHAQFFGGTKTLKEKDLTEYEKTAVPEDSVLVYGIMAAKRYAKVTEVLYTSPDMKKPDAPILHFVPGAVAQDGSLMKVPIVGYFVFTGIVPTDTYYEFVRWKMETENYSLRKIYYYVHGRDVFVKSELDFTTQKKTGLQYLGLFVMHDEVREVMTDDLLEKAESEALKELKTLYKGTAWEEVITKAMPATEKASKK